MDWGKNVLAYNFKKNFVAGGGCGVGVSPSIPESRVHTIEFIKSFEEFICRIFRYFLRLHSFIY